jgi:hypothetical protein
LRRLLHATGAVTALPEGWLSCPVAEGAGIAVEVPELIVHNTDVLVAAGALEGEAANTVAAALELGVPVLWVLPDGAVRLLTNRFWRVSTFPVPEGDAVWPALRIWLAAGLSPPPGPPPKALLAIEAGLRLPDRLMWRAHRTALQLLARDTRGAIAADPEQASWGALYGPADALANAYADRYRSSYTIVLTLAALALLAAVMGLRIEHHWPVASMEASCLAGILALVWANTRLDWRSRLIQCRLLAELCRKQAALAYVGRSLPSARIAALTREGGLDWIGWRFAAAVRAGPVPATALSGDALAVARDRAAAVLLHGQRAYHEARVALGRQREARLVRAGAAMFGLTVLFVAVKLGLLAADLGEGAEQAGLVAALLPAVAAALFGFRAYAELELMVQQSEHLVAVLGEAEASLGRIDPAAAGAARYIGDVFERTAAEMLADVAGWIQISRVKAVEAG